MLGSSLLPPKKLKRLKKIKKVQKTLKTGIDKSPKLWYNNSVPNENGKNEYCGIAKR